MDAVFHALAHGARRAMVSRLADSALTVGELAEPLAMSLAAASKHVRVLERAGLLRRTVDGRRHVCRLEAAPLASASDWLQFHQRHWRERLDGLQSLLRAAQARPEKIPEPRGRGAASWPADEREDDGV